MSSSRSGEQAADYQRFNNETGLPLDQEISNGSSRQYGSMLSSPSSESHVRFSFDNANTANQMNSKYEAGETGAGSMTENIVFTPCDATLDVDMHWEMNYHEVF